MNKENQAIDCNAVEISTKDKFKTTSNNQSPTRIYKQNTNVSSSQIYASNIMPNKSNGISNNRDFPIFDKSMSKKFILRGTTLTYDIIVDGINTSGIIDIIDSKISFGVPFKSTMSNGNSRFLFPFTISSRGQQHTFWAVSDKLRRSSMLILHEQSQSLKSIRPHLKPSEEIVGFGAVLRIKNVLSSNQVQLCVSNLPRLLVVDPILNSLLEQSQWSAKSAPHFSKIDQAKFKISLEGNKEYIFEDVKSGSGYWEEVFRNLAISLSRSQPYRSPARHLGMTNRVSPLRRSTPSPLRSISTQRGSSRHPSPSTMRKPISITPTRVIPALTTSTITSVHSDNSKYSNPANIAPLQIPAQISATEVYNTEALLQKDDSQLTTNTDYVNVEAVPDICQWQLPTELLLMNEPVIETTEPAVEYNVHDASPIESFRASTTSPTSKPNLTAPTSSSTTTHVPTYSSGGFNLYNAVYYTSFAVFLVAAGVMNTIYPSSTATAATASLTASTADTSIASLMSIPEYEGSSVGNTCSFTELFIGPVDVYSASQSDSDAAMISALGFSINRYSALHINIFDQSGPDFVYSVYSELDNDEE